MSRIKDLFETISHPVFVGFTVAGDPDEETSLKIIRAMIKGGTDIIELGLPFSDPASDGPVIQRADIRALNQDMNTDRLFSLVKKIRDESDVPIVILTYSNLILAYHLGTFYKKAKEAGIDGVVIADVPLEEAEPFISAADQAGVDAIMMISTTTSPERKKRILASGSGFVYMVAALGVTGTRQDLDINALKFLEEIQQMSSLPILPGFGISTPEQVAEWKDAGARGVIVGSALVQKIEDNLNNPEIIPDIISNEVKRLSAPLL